MADPPFPPKSKAPFFVIYLSGRNSNPIIPDAFFATHMEAKNELTKLKLTSDANDRTWEVKLNGRSFARGWQDFSSAHTLRADDVLIFRQDGEETFHVIRSGRSFSQILCISSSSDDSEDDDDDDDDSETDDDDDDEDDDGDDDDDEGDGDDDDDDGDDGDEDDNDDGDGTWDKVSDTSIISPKKKSRVKAESSSSENSCIIGVTPSNLRRNRVCLRRTFTRTNGLHQRWCEIDLISQSGKSWAMGLRYNNITGQESINGGWRSFCRQNKLKPRFFYRFKLVRNGTRPALQLCSDKIPQGSCSKANGKAKVSAKFNREGKSSSMDESKFMTVTLKPYMLNSRQLRLGRSFARENGFEKGGEVTLVDNNGGEWPSYVASARGNGGFYVAKSWIRFCEANGITTGDTFKLKFVRIEGKTPMLQFHSKAKIVQASSDVPRGTAKASRDEEETETRFQKRARVSAAGEPSSRTQASHKSTVHPKNLQCDQPLQTISDQVKQSIVDVLAEVRLFRSELEIKEQKLEALLKKIDVVN